MLAKLCLLLLKNLLGVISLGADPELVKPPVEAQPNPELLNAGSGFLQAALILHQKYSPKNIPF